MRHRILAAASAVAFAAGTAFAQQPAGVPERLANLADQPATHTSFTFDKNMMEMADQIMNQNPDGRHLSAALNGVTVQNFHYQQAAFYTPEAMADIIRAYNAAGWKHLVDAHVTPGQSAQPTNQLTDLWLHFRGAEIDDVTVLSRGPRNMSVIEISCLLRPLDLVHLSGHFGIPKVDPNAVMVAAPPGR